MYITYNITTFVDIPRVTHSFMYSMGLTHQPRNHQRWFMPRKKINTPGWTKIIHKEKGGKGNHQSPGKVPVTTMGSAQEQSIFDLATKTHEQFTAFITPRMLLSSPGLSTPLSSALLCPGVPDNNCRTDTKGNPDGHQSLQDCWGGARTEQRGQIVDRGWTLTLPALGRDSQLLGTTLGCRGQDNEHWRSRHTNHHTLQWSHQSRGNSSTNSSKPHPSQVMVPSQLTGVWPQATQLLSTPPTPTAAVSKGKRLARLNTPKMRHAASQHLNARHAQHHQPTGMGMSPPINWEWAHRLSISVPQQSGLRGSGPPTRKTPMNTFVCIIKLFFLAYGLPSTPSFPAVEEGVLEGSRKYSFSKWQQLLITRGLFSFPLACTAASEVKSVLHIKTSTGGTGMRRERWRQYSPCTAGLHSRWPQLTGGENKSAAQEFSSISPSYELSFCQNLKNKNHFSALKWLF